MGLTRSVGKPAGMQERTERCQSGRMGLTRNQVYGLPYRGFESHPLRQINKKAPFWGLFIYQDGGAVVEPTRVRQNALAFWTHAVRPEGEDRLGAIRIHPTPCLDH